MTYKISVLTDFNTASQISYLKSVSVHDSAGQTIGEALAIAHAALSNQQHGLGTRVWNKYDDGFSEFYNLRGNFSRNSTLENLQRQPKDDKASVEIYSVQATTARQIAEIKTMAKLPTDDIAVRFSLQMAYDLAKKIGECSGKAIVCCTNDVELSDGARYIKTSFEKTLGMKIGRFFKRF